MTATYSLFNVALITGGGGGLGKAVAQNFIKHGKQVIIAGRTESNLIEAQKDLGSACIAYYVVDLAKIETLSAFAQTVIAEHPEIDCVYNNAGITYLDDFKTGEIPEAGVIGIVNINVTALTILCNLFSPHLQNKASSVLANVTSGLAYVPVNTFAMYCASKAYVASLTRSIRVQLKDTNVRVVEVAPPLVDSNIHRNSSNASAYSSANNPNTLTQDQFIEQVEAGMASGEVEIGVGTAGDRLKLWQNAFGAYWRRVNGLQ